MLVAWSAKTPTAGHKCVLAAMAWHADPEGGSIRPSLTTIAEMASLSRDRVRVVVGDLVRSGHLAVVEALPGRAVVYSMGRPPQGVQTPRVGKEGTPRAGKEGAAELPPVPARPTPLVGKETPSLLASKTPLAGKERTEEQFSERAAGAAASAEDLESAMQRTCAELRPDLDFEVVHGKFSTYWRDRDVARLGSVEAFRRWLQQERKGERSASTTAQPVSKPTMAGDIPSLQPRTPAEMASAAEAAAVAIPGLLALRNRLARGAGR